MLLPLLVAYNYLNGLNLFELEVSFFLWLFFKVSHIVYLKEMGGGWGWGWGLTNLDNVQLGSILLLLKASHLSRAQKPLLAANASSTNLLTF